VLCYKVTSTQESASENDKDAEIIITRCSAIAERPRCRVLYSFGQKWKTGTGRQYFTDIIGLSSTTAIQSA